MSGENSVVISVHIYVLQHMLFWCVLRSTEAINSLPLPVFPQECDKEWVFVVGEQQFYAEKGFENEPTRCKECRKQLKDARRRKGKKGGKGKKGMDGGVKICYAFRDGECERGSECKFAHVTEENGAAVMEAETAEEK